MFSRTNGFSLNDVYFFLNLFLVNLLGLSFLIILFFGRLNLDFVNLLLYYLTFITSTLIFYLTAVFSLFEPAYTLFLTTDLSTISCLLSSFTLLTSVFTFLSLLAAAFLSFYFNFLFLFLAVLSAFLLF